MRRHFALFGALRGLAVLAVAVFHVTSLTGFAGAGALGHVATTLGGVGVTVFFAISGFLLYRPFAAARAAGAPLPSLARFARRRALRIAPAYWVALTLLIIFPGVALAGGAWRYYGFLQLYDADTIGLGIPVAWTLSVEVTFYLALPLWALGTRRLTARADAVALLLAVTGGAVVQVLAARLEIGRLWADALPGQATWLALGMLLAVWSVAEPDRIVRRPSACWLGALLALAGLAALAPDGVFGLLASLAQVQPLATVLARLALLAVLTVLFLAPAVFGDDAGGLPRRLLAWGPVAFLGTISYSFYLYHLTVAELLAHESDPHYRARGLGLDLNTPWLLALTVLVTGMIAAVSYRLLERPALRRR